MVPLLLALPLLLLLPLLLRILPPPLWYARSTIITILLLLHLHQQQSQSRPLRQSSQMLYPRPHQ